MINIFDNFIESYPELKAYSLTADYSGVENPVDKVVYPYICAEIPEAVKSEVLEKLTGILGREPEKVTMFLRQSPKGVHVPHIAHNDLSMGRYSLMLYLNDNPDGGTAIIRHKQTGICYAPESDLFIGILKEHQNQVDKWSIIESSVMAENRAAIFDAGLMHCALPIGGFGEGESSRVVLTAFFS